MGALSPIAVEPVLLVEDKAELRAMLRKFLERSGYSVDEAPDGSSAIEKVRARRYLFVLSDLKLPGQSGIDVLREAKRADSALPVILVTAYGSVEEAVTAMKEGAFDFIQKPVDLDHLKILLERAATQQELLRENLLLREEYSERYGFPRIVGEHPAMQEASQVVQRVAATDATVLLLGESGTGKELFARALHHLSPRRQQPFVALNCAAIPEGLVENELFGHERGAFTGAGARKIGKIELAHHGTIFLDEIGDLPAAIQSKLLRVLEERQFERVGGTMTVGVDVRLITATNRDLQSLGSRKTISRRSLFPHLRRSHHHPAAARTRRRRAASRRTFSRALPPRVPQARLDAQRGHGCACAKLSLAGKRPRAAKRHRARRDSFQRRRNRSPRPATSGGQAGTRSNARWPRPR